MKTIASYSIKGGVGKTAFSVNMAYASADAGMRTLLVDLDPQGASSFYFRVRPSEKLKAKGFFDRPASLEKNIRGSDYGRLDILPANLHYRKFDARLGLMQKPNSRLKKALKRLSRQYDVVILDCPPNIGLLSESVFVAADVIVVPVIPTTLSERTFVQLLKFFADAKYPRDHIQAFFSMAQTNNRLHRDTMARMREKYPAFLDTVIPQSIDVERMGIMREPVLAYAPKHSGAQAYRKLCEELLTRTGMK